MNMTLTEVINGLDLADAWAWEAETDQACWVEYNLLDPHGLRRSNGNIDAIEDRLSLLLLNSLALERTRAAEENGTTARHYSELTKTWSTYYK